MKNTLTTTQNQAAKDKAEYERKVDELKRECSLKVKSANERIDETEKRFAKDNATASKYRREAEDFRAEQQRLLREKQYEIDKLAEQKVSDMQASLKSAKEHEVSVIKSECKASIEKHKSLYKIEYAAKETWHVLVFTFCIVWLIIQALSSNYFRYESVELGIWIKDYVVGTSLNISEWTEGAAKITFCISNEIAFTILHWLIFIIVGILLITLFYVIPLSIIFGGSLLYLRSEFFDKINKWIMVGSGILFIAMSSEMFYQPSINLLFLWIILQAAIPLLRYIIIPLLCAKIDRIKNMDEG